MIFCYRIAELGLGNAIYDLPHRTAVQLANCCKGEPDQSWFISLIDVHANCVVYQDNDMKAAIEIMADRIRQDCKNIGSPIPVANREHFMFRIAFMYEHVPGRMNPEIQYTQFLPVAKEDK